MLYDDLLSETKPHIAKQAIRPIADIDPEKMFGEAAYRSKNAPIHGQLELLAQTCRDFFVGPVRDYEELLQGLMY